MKNVLFLIFALAVLPATAQNSGFFGKTSFVEITGVGSYPLTNNWISGNHYYKSDGKTLKQGKDRFNGGVYFAIGTAVKRNVALTLETGWWSFNVAGPSQVWFENSSYYTSYVNVKHENLDARTFSVMPIIEFGGKEGLLPIGISHQFGIGLAVSRIVKKDYRYAALYNDYSYEFYDEETGSYYTVEANDLLDSLHARNGGFVDFGYKQTGVTLLYGLKLRTPLTKNMLLSYGLHYALNLGPKSNQTEYSNNYDNDKWTMDQLQKTRFRSLISLNLGLAYVF